MFVIGSLSVLAFVGICIARSSIQDPKDDLVKDDDCSSLSYDAPDFVISLSPSLDMSSESSFHELDSSLYMSSFHHSYSSSIWSQNITDQQA